MSYKEFYVGGVIGGLRRGRRTLLCAERVAFMAPPLILVAGLGGTCSEAAVSIFDGLEAFYHPGVNRSAADDDIAGCGPRCPLRTEDVQALAGTQHTLLYNISRVEPGLLAHVETALASMLDAHACASRTCVYKEEHLLFLLPVFRQLAASRGQPLCVVLHTRAAAEWVAGHNWIGFSRWYAPLLGHADKLAAIGGSGWHVGEDDPSHVYTYDPSWMRMKAELWARVALQTRRWVELTADDPNVHNVPWRCKVDSRTKLARDVPLACGDLRDLANMGGDEQWRPVSRTKGKADQRAQAWAEEMVRNVTAHRRFRGLPAGEWPVRNRIRR